MSLGRYYSRTVTRRNAERFVKELINYGASFCCVVDEDAEKYTLTALTGTKNEVQYDQAAYACGLKRKR